jgi:hypothetical protein
MKKAGPRRKIRRPALRGPEFDSRDAASTRNFNSRYKQNRCAKTAIFALPAAGRHESGRSGH